jgi:hypothetical protein
MDSLFSMEFPQIFLKNMTVYNFDTIDVDGKPEVQFKCLKRLVGERGFEPPTPWSEPDSSSCGTLLNFVDRNYFVMNYLQSTRSKA